jgi:hypothetical protein
MGARLESEAIHASARQSRKSWRTPYFRQSRDREGALAKCVAGKRSLTVAAPIGVPRSSTSVSRTPHLCFNNTLLAHKGKILAHNDKRCD